MTTESDKMREAFQRKWLESDSRINKANASMWFQYGYQAALASLPRFTEGELVEMMVAAIHPKAGAAARRVMCAEQLEAVKALTTALPHILRKE